MKKSLIVSLGVIFSLVACSDYQAEYEDKYEALVSEPIEVLDSSAKELSEQLLAWLNFWVVGNHDDRTIVVMCKGGAAK